MPKEQFEMEILAPPEKVFVHIDDINNVGWHMSGESSMPMMEAAFSLK